MKNVSGVRRCPKCNEWLDPPKTLRSSADFFGEKDNLFRYIYKKCSHCGFQLKDTDFYGKVIGKDKE